MMRAMTIGLTAVVAAGASFPADAAKDPPPRPAVFQKLIDCRAVADAAARLACFDAQVAQLDEAERANDVVVVDRAEVKKARRGLFGLSLPDLGGLFGGGKDDEEEEVSEIETTIKAAAQNKVGKLVFTIADGARWVQTDGTSLLPPKSGTPVKIRKAAMGSFFANIDGKRAIRVRREN